MLVNCTVVRDFWNIVPTWWNNQNNDNNYYAFDEVGLLYGYNPEDRRTRIFDYFIVLPKRHIFLQKLESKTPNVTLFFNFVREKLLLQKALLK